MSSKNRMTSKDILNDFCQNSTVPASGYLIRTSRFERLLWTLYILIGITGIIYIAHQILQEWYTEAVYITLDASSRRIDQVDFPGVAICDVNKISKQRAIDLATKLNAYTTEKNFQETLNLVRLLGNMYDANVYGAENFAKLDSILNSYDNGTTGRDLLIRFSSLTTPCRELLRSCSWNSKAYDCMDLFQTRLTDTGFCCVFNYIRSSPEALILSDSNKEVPKKSRKFLGTGIRKGLSVTVNNNFSDYFYTSLATRGCSVNIFLPGDFPDATSGSLRAVMVRERSEVFVNVEANILITQDQVRSLTIAERNCMYIDEEKTAFGYYSSSNCYVSCRLKSILTLCNCVPFILATGNTDDKYMNFCNLLDIPCLNRHRGKWSRIYPFGASDINELNLEAEDSLMCKCWPNCDDVTYAINTNYFDFSPKSHLYPNSSKIHVYSSKSYNNVFKKEVSVTWFEYLNYDGKGEPANNLAIALSPISHQDNQDVAERATQKLRILTAAPPPPYFDMNILIFTIASTMIGILLKYWSSPMAIIVGVIVRFRNSGLLRTFQSLKAQTGRRQTTTKL